MKSELDITMSISNTQNRQSPCLRYRWRFSGRSLPSLPNLDEIESGVEELPFLLLLLFPPLLEEPEVDAEEEPLDLSSLGLLDDDELVLELEDFKEELFWFPEFEPEGLEVCEISSLCPQYLWSICWESVWRSMMLSGLP